MRIVFVCTPVAFGGSEVQTIELANLLSSRGHDVTIAEVNSDIYRTASKRNPAVSVTGIFTESTPKSVGYRKWRELLRGISADCCILPKGCITDGSLLLDLALRRHFGCLITIEHSTPRPLAPCSGTLRGRHSIGLGLWRHKKRWAIRSRHLAANAIICVCRKAKDILTSDYRFPSAKISVVPNGVDVSRFCGMGADGHSVRSAWGIQSGSFVFGTVGRLSKEKNLILAIRAFKKLLDSAADRECYLVVVGEGPEAFMLKSIASDEHIAEHVVFAGFMGQAEQAYAAIDAFLLTSTIEGLPLSLLEAMAAGCVSIATDVGGVSEVISHAENGFLIASGDVEGLARSMAEVRAMTQTRRKSVSEAARMGIEESFNSSVQTRRLADVIDAVVQRCVTAPA